MLLALLAQAPAPASPPPTDLTPVLLTVAGAFGGVLLTLAIQAAIARAQRRHENQGRAHAVRLELYRDLLPKYIRIEVARLAQEDPAQDPRLASALEDEVRAASTDVRETIKSAMLFADWPTIAAISEHLAAVEGDLNYDVDATFIALRNAIRGELGIERDLPIRLQIAMIRKMLQVRRSAAPAPEPSSSPTGEP